jgi:hypothetical protein
VLAAQHEAVPVVRHRLEEGGDLFEEGRLALDLTEHDVVFEDQHGVEAAQDRVREQGFVRY